VNEIFICKNNELQLDGCKPNYEATMTKKKASISEMGADENNRM
jgi:hypothetical protein